MYQIYLIGLLLYGYKVVAMLCPIALSRYDAELFMAIEDHINKNKDSNDSEKIQITKYDMDKGEVMKLHESVMQAEADAKRVNLVEQNS